MIGPAPGTRIFLACGHTDMRRGMDGLAALVQQAFGQDPFTGAIYLFRGKRGRLMKCVWHDGQGLCLFAKRLEQGHFPWPVTSTGTVMLSAAQASMLLEGHDGARRHRLGQDVGALLIGPAAAALAARHNLDHVLPSARGSALTSAPKQCLIVQPRLRHIMPVDTALSARRRATWDRDSGY